MKKLLRKIAERLPGKSISLSWTWDLGPRPRGTIKRGSWLSLLSCLRFPGSRPRVDTKGPPSATGRNPGPEVLTGTGREPFSNKPEKKPMQFPSVYTKANSTYLRSFATVQKFPLERPSGVTVHYTATGHISSTITELQKKSLGYHMLLDRDGTIYQCADLTKTLWHAGRALWRGASPNREHLALALVSWGWVTELAPGLFESWSGHVVPTRAVVKRWPMWWEAATRAQEEALLSVLEWIVGQGVPAENVCGHNECALPAGRKVDPGGVLSFSMDVLRDRLAGRKPES